MVGVCAAAGLVAENGTRVLPAAASSHWAYRQPRRPELPAVDDRSWPRNAIDHFVLARLEEEGLSPAPEAERSLLSRRLGLDLIGLPPSIAEVDAFLAAESPEAYDRFVERLLSSPRYGERWARLWLDLARYADTQGYEKDNRRTIWRYRDWVIAVLNQDLPFDRFTVEQLAGDLLPESTSDQLIATAFHRNTMTNTEGGTDDEEFRVAAIVDRVNTTMQVWMGTTFGCGQCHSHKYDPISQREYYQVFAFFNNTEDSDRSNESPTLSTPTPWQKDEIDRLESAIADAEEVLGTQTPQLDAAQTRWEERLSENVVKWVVLEPVSFSSENGATLTRLEDGSILASGKSPATDTYTVRLDTDLSRITGFRLELLTHDSLPGKGPGRHKENGDLVLNELRVTALPRDESSRSERPGAVALENAIASFSGGEEGGSSVEKAIDGDAGAKSGWAIQPRAGTTHVAVFETRDDLGFEGGTTFTFTLVQSRGKEHTIGRLRLSATTKARPLNAAALPEQVFRLLTISAEGRDARQREELAVYYRSIAPELEVSRQRLTRLKKDLAAIKPPTTPVLRELPAEKARATHIHIRGNFLDKGAEVEAGVPEVFHPMPEDYPRNRLGFSRWLVDRNNPLTARVMMNRLWEQYFGIGLVATSEDFGTQGEPSSHPELLDWLATEFMRQNWSLKAMHRLIVTSATYRQSSRVTPELSRRDPYNRLLARGPRFRLEAEMVRDQALSVSGLLSHKMCGPSVMPPQPPGVWQVVYSGDKWVTSRGEDKYRRGLYTFWRRTSPHPAMVAFDAPSREFCVMRRLRTNTPLQALVTLNDPAYVEAAQALARRIMVESGPGPGERAAHGFRLCLARRPRPAELERLTALYRSELAFYQKDSEAAKKMTAGTLGPAPEGLSVAELAAWTVVSNVLLNLDEMLTKG